AVTGGRTYKFPLRSDDFERVIQLWLSGQPLESIFAQLPYLHRSSRRSAIDAWLLGQSSAWDTEFDKFTDFVSAVFGSFLPWLMHACEALSVYVGGSTIVASWRHWADLVEHGVDS